MRSRALRIAFVFTMGVMGGLAPGIAFAHQHRPVAGFETTVGWVSEPAFAGFQNGVQFIIERPAAGHTEGDEHAADEHAEGTAVTNAKLRVEVFFGDTDAAKAPGADKIEAELSPAFGAPGEYHATLIPTRSGTYTFRIFGTVGRTTFDQYYTSGDAGKNDDSEGTYNDVGQPKDIQFPSPEPANFELEDRITSESTRLTAAVDLADESASLATWLAIGGLVLGLAALLVAMMNRKARA